MFRGILIGVIAALELTGALGQDEATVELDFQTAQEQREPFEASDFTLPLSGEPGDGNIQAFFGTIDTVPALATLPDEISQARFELAPCALVAPHVHPRGTELLFVYEGAVTLGWSEENGGRVLENNITAGSSGFVPQGLINWVQNNNCERALYVSTFPTTDFGVTSITPQLFSLPATVLRGTFASLDPELLDAVITAVTSDDPAPSADPECLARCGLDGGAMAPMAGGNEAMEEDAADASSPAEAAEESGGDESGGEESGGEETGGEESGGDESGGEDSGNYEASEGPRMQGGRMMGPSKQDKKGDH